MHNKGFTLLEMCVVIFMMTLFISVYQIGFDLHTEYYDFSNAYLEKQAFSIARAEPVELQLRNEFIRFNERGNINQARTLYFDQMNQKIILELAGGRLVYQ